MGYGLDEGFDYDQNDEYADALAEGVWVQRDGSGIRIGQMTTSHLRGAVRVAEGAAKRATCTSEKKVKVKSDADSTKAGEFGELLAVNFYEKTVMLGFPSKVGGDFIKIKYFFHEVEEVAPVAIYVSPKAVKPARGAKLTMICHCGTEYEARKADIQRGWGLSCSKRCASIRREYGRPAARQKEHAARSRSSAAKQGEGEKT